MLRLALCAVLSVSMPALAQSSQADVEQRFTPAEMHEAGLDTLSPAQLAALNRLLRENAVRTSSSASARPMGEQADRFYIGLDDKPIHSRVAGTVEGWDPGTVFVLENGQRWKVLKGAMKLRKPLQAPEIVVVPGIAGRWFLQVDEDMPKARVYRID
ncbi:hypothetical protein [Lysobacter sp. Root494]|uniref:hypothetical protein n=1 Tax=Lysobacter sp. Root494 TaxID=1736549 RepID=UPI0006FE15DE|nr:hypothetical protein [Lysobacter sp. Root494]KQY49673.1 hypothetical protein ASD14_13155 [Lysobacter sp. Root494]